MTRQSVGAAGTLQGTAGIEAMFDGISYQKGGTVLRMLRAYLNRDTAPAPLLRRRRLLQVPVLAPPTILNGCMHAAWHPHAACSTIPAGSVPLVSSWAAGHTCTRLQLTWWCWTAKSCCRHMQARLSLPPACLRDLAVASSLHVSLRQAASSDPWLQGLSTYLRTYQFQTATASQLWSTLSDASGEDVSSWMQPWTYRPGFPVVNVTLGGTGGLDVMVSQVCFCRLCAGCWHLSVAWALSLCYGTALYAC